MTVYVVDVGNTRTKAAAFPTPSAAVPFPEPVWVEGFSTDEGPGDSLDARLSNTPIAWRIIGVHRAGVERFVHWVETNRPVDTTRCLSRHELPIAVHVDFPDRVGLDRLAAAVAVDRLRSRDRAAVAIGAGTAMTVDVVSPDGAFEGGAILPGFRMAGEALAAATDQLPFVAVDGADEPPPAIGKSTEAAIRSGLFWGAVGAARELLRQVERRFGSPPQVFVAGGDLRRLHPLLGDGAQFTPHLPLKGLAWSAMEHPPRAVTP